MRNQHTPGNRKTIILASVLTILLLLYLPFDRPFGTVYSFYTFVDDWIPLRTVFIIPYVSYYFLLLFSLGYFTCSKKQQVTHRIAYSAIIATLASYLFYFFYQNAVDRPVVEPQNIFDQIYVWINSQVPPYNAFPSLHVAISAICLYGYHKLKTKWFKLFSIWVVLIIISTVLTKQHYFLDIIGGLVLAYGSIWATKRWLVK